MELTSAHSESPAVVQNQTLHLMYNVVTSVNLNIPNSGVVVATTPLFPSPAKAVPKSASGPAGAKHLQTNI